MGNYELLGTSIVGFGRSDSSSKVFQAKDPATGRELAPKFNSATHEDLEAATRMARSAFHPYAALPSARRAAFLRAIATEFEALGDALVSRAVQETGLPEARIRAERERTCFQMRFFASILEEGSWVDARIDIADPTRTPMPKPDVRSMLRPLGPVAVFGASNFPLAYSVAGGDTASALAAGCPVIALAHFSHPGTAELVGVAVQRAAKSEGMPEGVFSMLFAADKQIGAALVEHPAMAAVGFTGSRAGGTALLRLAQARPMPIPFYAEMSSVNPVIIMPHAMKARGQEIVAGLHNSITLHAGQYCTNPGLVLLEESAEAKKFEDALAAQMGATQPATMLNQDIWNAYNKATAARGSTAGVRTLAEKEPAPVEYRAQSRAMLFEVDAETFTSQSALQEEVFGPSSLIVKCRDREQMLKAVEGLEGNLTATIHMDDGDRQDAKELIARLEGKAGRIVINGYPTGVEVCQAIVHGGPWPSTSDARTTSVGGRAIERFARPLCYQNTPQEMLPDELQDENPKGILRIVNGERHREKVRQA